MDNSRNKLLYDVKKELKTLEDAFYDGIPNELFHDEHIIQFCHDMEVIHSRIMMLVGNSNHDTNASVGLANLETSPCSSISPCTSNINYSQLKSLSSKTTN